MHRSRRVALGTFLLLALGVEARARAEAEAKSASVTSELMALLPLELTAFGDIRFRFTEPATDKFEIGSVELDSALQLSPYVMVSAAFAYSPDEDKVGLGAFTVDGSLFGPEKKHLFKCPLLQDSGVVFGKFDVPFGIAYLEYPATENRFVNLPGVVMATHGAWNDLGMQAYAMAEHFDLTLYFVNGDVFESDETAAAGMFAHHAYGGRLGLKPIELLSFGASVAEVGGSLDTGMWGADLSMTAGPLVVKNEYVRRTPADAPAVHGAYTEAQLKLGRFFAGARYETTLEGAVVTDNAGAASLGAEVFPQGEIRVAHLRSFETDSETTYIQLVGGSIWQPTGLRR